MGPNDPNEDSGWGQAPLARDGSRAETDTRRRERGRFEWRQMWRQLRLFSPWLTPHTGSWACSPSDLIQRPNGWGTRCPSVIGFGLGGQENTKIDAQCHCIMKKRKHQWIQVWKYWMNEVRGDNWQIVFTNDKISWSKVAFPIQFAVYFSFEIWQKMTNRI